jgi:hypothetical protein
MTDHITARLSAPTIAPTVTPAGTDGVVDLVLGEVLIEGTHEEVRAVLVGALALVDHDARLLERAAVADRDDDYSDAAIARTENSSAVEDRLSWSPGDVVITPPPAAEEDDRVNEAFEGWGPGR